MCVQTLGGAECLRDTAVAVVGPGPPAGRSVPAHMRIDRESRGVRMSGGPDGDGWTNQSPANHRRLPRGESGSARCLKETRKFQESYLDIELNVL